MEPLGPVRIQGPCAITTPKVEAATARNDGSACVSKTGSFLVKSNESKNWHSL